MDQAPGLSLSPLRQRVASYPSLPLEEPSVTRLHRLVAHPRRTLGALAVVLAAIGITVGSGANFTASAANPGNAFTHRHAVDRQLAGHRAAHAAGMKPGDTATGTVDITNTGSLAGDFALKTANTTGYAALLDQMDLAVLDCGAWTDHRSRLRDRDHHRLHRQGQRR